MYEYVCNECEAVLTPEEIAPHRNGHDQVAVTVTRRDIYEEKYGEVDG